MSDVTVIVLAAGSARRFGEAKQFLEIADGVRLVDAAVDSALDVSPNVILVLPEDTDWDGAPGLSVVTGGDSRLDSAATGLSALGRDQEVVVIHDAAHPLAPRRTFEEIIGAIREGAVAAVPFLPVADVIKQESGDGRLSTVGRDGMGLAQVPMAFRPASLEAAHEARGSIEAWDDTMLIEAIGGEVVAVTGSSRNIHVVTPEDLELARLLYGGPQGMDPSRGS